MCSSSGRSPGTCAAVSAPRVHVKGRTRSRSLEPHVHVWVKYDRNAVNTGKGRGTRSAQSRDGEQDGDHYEGGLLLIGEEQK